MTLVRIEMFLISLVCCGLVAVPVSPAPGADTGAVKLDVDWPAFLARHDLVWNKLPERFDHGAFLGNGLLGAMIYKDAPNGLRWEIGRSDVTAHRRDNNRLPIGGLRLKTAGTIQGGTMRLKLWDAEVGGEVRTDKGRVAFRSFIHADDLVEVIEIRGEGGESAAAFEWDAAPAVDQVNRSRFKDDPPNPPARTEQDRDVTICVQPRHAGGQFATAWTVRDVGDGLRRCFLSVGDTFPGDGAAQAAASAVRAAGAADFDALTQRHRRWWHAYYPGSFLSFSDARAEGFYWAQMYKLACATRADRMVMDLLGPWFRKTGWPRIWWNLNIQICYSPVYPANRLELGESLVRFLDAKRANFARNARQLYGLEDGATVPHTTCYEGLRGDGSRAPDHYINPGDFTWALHNYWQHYRYSMDHSLLTDTQKHALFALLRQSVNVYLKLLTKGDDGKLHLPVLHSPEYGNVADNNYNLALLRWACRTLIDLAGRYRIDEPLLPRYRQVLADLVDYPRDDTGMWIGANMPYARSHRHWSHLLMMYPLYLVNADQPGGRELMDASIRHWLTAGGGGGIFGWSRAAAASLYASVGDGERARENLYKHLDDRRFVMPNTMYIEGSPVIECAFVAARAILDMHIQSWGGAIRVFPALPAQWPDAAFHDLRAEGAFLVSASRHKGKTQWVRVKSLASEPCRIRPGIEGDLRAWIDGRAADLKPAGPDGTYEIPLARGQTVLIAAGPNPPDAVVAPVPGPADSFNTWGEYPRPKPSNALSVGKPARASSTWSAALAAAKAFDDDESTRWGARPGSRDGWIEVDLGEEKLIGRVVVKEIGYPRTEKFALQIPQGDQWKSIVEGDKLGCKTLDFAPVRARRVRLNILQANEVPTIEEIQVFGLGGK